MSFATDCFVRLDQPSALSDLPENQVLWRKDRVLRPLLVQELLQLGHVGLLEFGADLSPPRLLDEQFCQSGLNLLGFCLLGSSPCNPDVPATHTHTAPFLFFFGLKGRAITLSQGLRSSHLADLLQLSLAQLLRGFLSTGHGRHSLRRACPRGFPLITCDCQYCLGLQTKC